MIPFSHNIAEFVSGEIAQNKLFSSFSVSDSACSIVSDVQNTGAKAKESRCSVSQYFILYSGFKADAVLVEENMGNFMRQNRDYDIPLILVLRMNIDKEHVRDTDLYFSRHRKPGIKGDFDGGIFYPEVT